MDTKGLFKKAVNLVTLASFLLWNMAVATPEGGSVAQGSAAISQSGSSTTVNQTSQNAVINWNSFNTASHEAVTFNQPNASAVALNRINNGLPTQFAGQLNANGNVWILNPAGVLFTSTAKVDVAGLLATTHAITDQNFMSGNYRFDLVPGSESASIINNGLISAKDSGIIALVAPHVQNNGLIQVNLGKVSLSSGASYVLDMYGDSLINFGSNAPINNGSVSNAGQIIANGGKVYMTANYASGVLDNMISMSGSIQAKSAGKNAKGEIVLFGGNQTTKKLAGTTKVSGKLDTASADNAVGGFIETSGYDVNLLGADIKTGVGGKWLLDPPTIYTSTWGTLISDQLNAGTNVQLSTGISGIGTGDIYVDAPITWTTTAQLMLAAFRDINISEPVLATNSGGFIARADLSANGTGTVNFSGSGSITVNGTNGYAKLFYNPSSYATPTNYSSFLLGSAPIKAGYMMINTQSQLLAAGAVGSPNTNYNYALNNDIDMTGVPLSSPIFNSGFGNNFKGNFEAHNYADGLNKTISNITLSTGGGGVGALMTYLDGRVDNLTLSNLSLTAGGNYGGLAWSNNGTISNVHVSGNLVGTSFSGGGGITGENQGVIKNSWFSGSINSSGLLYIGGITGYLNTGASIINSYNEGSVTGAVAGGVVGLMIGVSTITNVYSVGAISGGSAIIGAANVGGSTITGAYWNTTTSSTGSAYGGGFAGSYSATGLNDTNMKIASNFPTFDFLTTWTTNGDTTYPQLTTMANESIQFAQFAGKLDPAAAGQTVNIYADNILIGSAIVESNGNYYATIFTTGAYLTNPSLILATTSGAVTGDYLGIFYGPVGNMNIVNNQVTLRSDTGIGILHSDVAALPNVNLFVGSGNDIILNPAASYLTTAGVVYSPVFSTTSTVYAINGNISQGVNVTFNGPVFVFGTSTITNTGNTVFASTLDGPLDIAINSNGFVEFNRDIGGVIVLDSLNVTAGNGIIINPTLLSTLNITTTNNQAYNGSVVLLGNAELVSTSSSVNLNGDINGPFDLMVNAGTTALFGNYGTTTYSLINSLTVTAPDGITIVSNVDGVNNLSTINDMTFNSIIYGGPYTLVNLSTTGGGDITLSTYVSLTDYYSRNNLNVTSSGSITLKGDITLVCPVGVFAVGPTFSAANTINIDGASNIYGMVTGVTFNGKVVLYNDVSVSGWFNGVFFNDTVNGPYSLSVGLLNNGAASTFTFAHAFGDTSPLANLTISTPASSVNFNAPISVQGIFTVQASSGDVTFNAPMMLEPSSQWIINGSNVFVNAPMDGGGHLHINTGNSTVLNATLGAMTPLEDMNVVGSQITIATSGITTNGTQVYSGPVSLSVDSTLTSNNSGITFNSTVEGPGGLVANVNNGTMYANNHMGFNTPLGYLTVNGTAQGVNVISVGDINMGPFNVVTNDLVQSLAGNVNLTGGPVTLFANLDVIAAEQILFGTGANGVTGPFALSAQSLNPIYGSTGQGVTGTVNVASLTVGGAGGANLSQNYPTTESFVAGQGVGQAFTNTVIAPSTPGSLYCVNNFCALIPVPPVNNPVYNIPPVEMFKISVPVVCPSGGCSNLEIIMDDITQVGIVSCVLGFMQAVNENGVVRILLPGSMLYAGDTVRGSGDSQICVKDTLTNKVECRQGSNE